MRKFSLYLGLLVITLFAIGAVGGVEWMFNIFGFYSWVSFLLYLALFIPGSEKAIIASYVQGKHAPAWVDFIFYFGITAMLAGSAHWVYAVIWLFKGWIDIYFRNLSKRNT